jgi:hypothetical protein
MPSTYSTSLKLELIGDGEQSGIWGQTTNNNLGTLLEQAITGVVDITMTDANYTLSSFNGVSDEARNAVLVVGGTNAAVRDIIAPLVEKLYVVKNNTVGGFGVNIKGSTGSAVLVPSGATVWVYCDGTNFNAINTESVGNFEVNGNLTVTGNTNAANATYTGNVAALNFSGGGLTLTSINASNISAGTIANARTTGSASNGASTLVLRDANGSFAANVGTFTTVSGNGAGISAINASNISSGTIANARTTAASANGASTIVARDANGSFAANVGTFTSISGNGVALTAINASNITSGTIANARTTGSASNGASTIVLRDSNGSFAGNVGTFTDIAGGTANFSGNVFMTGTGAFKAPNGTTAQRPGSPVDGMLRYNSDEDSFEGYIDGAWGGISGAQANGCIYENNTDITANYTLTTGKNGFSVGPIEIASGVTITIPGGQRWVVL